MAGSGLEFLKVEARYFSHHIIDYRLKRGRGFAGDFVGQFIQSIAYCQLGGHFGDGVPCRFGSQCG